MHPQKFNSAAWALVTLATILSYASAASGPTVVVSSSSTTATIIGTTTVISSPAATVNKYLGIPFAQPPLKSLRFAPPADITLKGKINATVIKPACIEQYNDPSALQKQIFDPQNPPNSEDCLYLNVFAPSTTPPATGWTVMFWLYGGNLEAGDAGLNIYDGSFFAGHANVIIVTTNYRLNVFGFPNSPAITPINNNVGFLDQRKALTWVQNNIKFFGGNPEKITIFGESAGAYSVLQLVANPPSPLGYRAAIMESTGFNMGADSAQHFVTLADQLGCTSTNAATQLNCMRGVSATAIQNQLDMDKYTFSPVVDNVTFSANSTAAILANPGPKVPILLGTNSQEGRAFAFGITNVTAYIQSIAPGNQTLQNQIAAAYPMGNQTAYEVAAEIITDLAFTCPTRARALFFSMQGYDVWRYYFNASFPNNQPVPNIGVYHSSEIPEVFETYNRTNPTAQQIALSSYMLNAWASFAKNPTSGPGWPQFLNTTQLVGDLGGNGIFGEQTINATGIDANCAVLAPLYG